VKGPYATNSSQTFLQYNILECRVAVTIRVGSAGIYGNCEPNEILLGNSLLQPLCPSLSKTAAFIRDVTNSSRLSSKFP
jgi:hypothetical protein